MPITSIICGVLLIFVGIIGYIHGVLNDRASLTAFIPAVFGVLLVGLGAAAGSSGNLRKHLMHAAVLIALLGFLMPIGRILSKLSEFTPSPAALAQLAMSLICLVFVVLCVRSFIAARAAR